MKQKVYTLSISYFELERTFGIRKARFISKLDYWLSVCGKEISSHPGKWIYNTISKWADQLDCSISTVKRTIKSLEEQKVLLSKKVNAKRYNHTKWYTLDYQLLKSFLKSNSSKIKKNKSAKTNRLAQNGSILSVNSIFNYTNNSSINKNTTELNNTGHRNIENKNKRRTILSDKQKELVSQMVQSWNKIFSYSSKPIKAYYSKCNAVALFDILDDKFQLNIQHWEEYAKKVNSSKFLMGEKKTRNDFKASFSWLIKKDTIEKIQAGEYGIGDRELDINNLDKNIQHQEHEIKTITKTKILQHLKNIVNFQQEKKIFEEYLLKSKFDRDNDKYQVKFYLNEKWFKYTNLINTNQLYYSSSERQRNNVFASYLMSKYLGTNEMELEHKILSSFSIKRYNRLQEIKHTKKQILNINVCDTSKDAFKALLNNIVITT